VHAGEIGRVRIRGMTSFFMIDSGTVQVGLRLTVVIWLVTIGEGRSGLPTTTT